MLKVLNKTKDKVDLIVNGEPAASNSTSNSSTANGATADATGRRKKTKISAIMFECHNVIDVLDEVTRIIQTGTDVDNQTYPVTRIERMCNRIIDCGVTKKDCDETEIALLTTSAGRSK